MNKFYEVTFNSDHPFLFITIIGLCASLFAAFYFFYVSRMFIPGEQYRHTIKRLNPRKAKELGNTKNIAKDEKRRVADQEFEVKLSRLRWNMNAEEYRSISRLQMLLGLITGMIFIVIGILVPKFTVQLVVLGMICIVVGFMYNSMKFSSQYKKLQRDTLQDIARMVSLYKNSDTSRGFYGVVQDYMGTANALKKDLEFYVSDLNSYGEEHALDKLGERVQLPQMFDLITYIKSSQTTTKTQFEANLHVLDRKLAEELKEINRKESARRFRTTMMTIIPVLAAVMFIFILTQIYDIVMVTQSL